LTVQFKSRKGVTLIELLISIAILGTIMTVVIMPLTTTFKLTGKSNQTLTATTQAQQVAEIIRGQWRSYAFLPNPDGNSDIATENNNRNVLNNNSKNKFQRNCIDNYSLPTNVAVTVSALDDSASVSSSTNLQVSTSCTGTPVDAPMKRITISVTAPDAENSAKVSFDMPNYWN